MHRRTLLAALGAVGAAGLTGCVNVGGRQPEARSRDDSTGTMVSSSHIETIQARCGTQDAGTSWELHSDTITITGHRPAPTPCHSATLEEVKLVEGILVVVIGATSTFGPTEECVQCVGRLQYEATVTLDRPGDLESIDVRHTGW